MTDSNVDLLDQLLAQSDETMAAITAEIEQSMPGPDHPMWARRSRERRQVTESPANSILNRPGRLHEPDMCRCLPDDLPTLEMQPRIDLAGQRVICQRCNQVIPKAIRKKSVKWLRGLLATYQQNPLNVDVVELRRLGVIYDS